MDIWKVNCTQRHGEAAISWVWHLSRKSIKGRANRAGREKTVYIYWAWRRRIHGQTHHSQKPLCPEVNQPNSQAYVIFVQPPHWLLCSDGNKVRPMSYLFSFYSWTGWAMVVLRYRTSNRHRFHMKTQVEIPSHELHSVATMVFHSRKAGMWHMFGTHW